MARKRHNIWQSDVYVDGKRVRKNFKTEALAVAFEQAMRLKYADDTIGTLFPQWADELWLGTKNERCAIGNAHLLVKWLGPKLSVHDLTFAVVTTLIKGMKDRGSVNATINKKIATLSALLGYGINAEVIKVMPKLTFLPVEDGRITVLTFDQEDAMMARLSEDHRHFANFCLYTGCRYSEAANLKWEDVDMKGAVQVRFWNTKTGKPRSIPLASPALRALQTSEALGWASPFQWISYRAFVRAWHEAREAVGLGPEYVPYVMRHTCATRLAKTGMTDLKLMNWMGHASLMMTRKYTHMDTSDLQEGANALERGPKLAIVQNKA